MEILIYILPFAVCSPLLIIAIIRFVRLSDYKAANLEKTEATLRKTDYGDSGLQSHSSYTYSYTKIGTYSFELDGNTYEFTFSADRELGHLPEKITACYPKGKPNKAFAEYHAPVVKEFFKAALFIFLYLVSSQLLALIAMFLFQGE